MTTLILLGTIMEVETSIVTIQKLQSGSIYIVIDQDARERLGWNPRDKVKETVDLEKKQLIVKRVSSPIPP